MKLKRKAAVLFVSAFLSGGAWATDVWDSSTDNDDTVNGTDNVLWHTAPGQVHDLQAVGGVADIDYFRVVPRARRSYEVQVLSVTGDVGAGGSLMTRRTTADALLQNDSALDASGFIRSIRWIQTTDADQRIRVSSGSTTATFASQYTILFRETTLYCTRYNNAGTQTSVLIIQRSDANNANSCSYDVHFHDASGNLTGSTSGIMNFVDDVDVIPTSAVTGVGGTSGAAYIAHTCGIGGFKAKMVALEPSTGFSFDTPCTEKDR